VEGKEGYFPGLKPHWAKREHKCAPLFFISKIEIT